MTIEEQYRILLQKLSAIYSDGEAAAIGEMVIEHYTGVQKNQRLSWQQHISAETDHKIEQALQELLQHRPVQYVLQHAWFRNMCFYVNEAVLIPRPETEELVMQIEKTVPKNAAISILDIGSGSGCIPIALKKALPQSQVSSIDISPQALAVARQNAAALQAEVVFTELDFLNEHTWPTLGNYDIIVSNPPYIPIAEKQILDKNVTDWEPGLALFVPNNDPLLFYKKIAAFGTTHLAANGSIFLECHQQYAQHTAAVYRQLGYHAEVIKDIFDNERMIKAFLPQ